MSESRTGRVTPELLQCIAVDMNFAPPAASRAAQMAALVDDTTRRIAQAALELPFDSSPYAFSAWLATLERR